MKKKIITWITSFLTVAFLVSALPITAQEKIEITFWHAMNGPHQEEITRLVEEFNASQDTYQVVEQNQGDYSTLQQSIMASGVSGDLPTMAQLTASNVVDYADQQLTIPLDDHLTAENGFTDELKDDIVDGYLTGVRFNDQYYAIPFSKSVRLMFVNQTLMDEVGAEIPSTWEDVKELSELLKSEGIDTYGIGLENGFSMEVETMARQNGAVWIADDLSGTDIGSPEATEPMQFIKDLVDQDLARLAGEDGYMSGPFSNGASALYIGSSAGLPYVLPGMEENDYTLTTVPVPVYGEGEALTLFAGNDLGVFASATDEEIQGAIQFIAFLLQPENTAQWAITTGYLPITQSAIESDTWQAYLEENPYVQAASDSVAFGESQVPYPGSSEVFSEMQIAIENIMLNDADVQTEFQRIEDLVNSKINP